MKRIAKPATVIFSKDTATPKLELPPVSDISVQRLIDDSLLALYREVKNILAMSVNGKLDANTARDLRDHLKLLFELKDRELEALKGLSDEELELILAQTKQDKKDIPGCE